MVPTVVFESFVQPSFKRHQEQGLHKLIDFPVQIFSEELKFSLAWSPYSYLHPSQLSWTIPLPPCHFAPLNTYRPLYPISFSFWSVKIYWIWSFKSLHPLYHFCGSSLIPLQFVHIFWYGGPKSILSALSNKSPIDRVPLLLVHYSTFYKPINLKTPLSI